MRHNKWEAIVPPHKGYRDGVPHRWYDKPEPITLEEGTLSREDIRVDRAREVIAAVPTVRVKPALPSIMASAYATIQAELRALRDRVEDGRTLDKDEVTKLHKLTDALVRLAREEREQEKRDDPSKIPLPELLEQAREALDIMTDTD